MQEGRCWFMEILLDQAARGRGLVEEINPEVPLVLTHHQVSKTTRDD